VTATPLQMSLVSAAIANDGVMASPHMVSKVVSADGDTLESFEDGASQRIMSSGTAEQLRSAMVTVVEDGTGSNARIPGLEVGGKTGRIPAPVRRSPWPCSSRTRARSARRSAATGWRPRWRRR
jgi:membrane peptidoglycan carboxypeptidase